MRKSPLNGSKVRKSLLLHNKKHRHKRHGSPLLTDWRAISESHHRLSTQLQIKGKQNKIENSAQTS